MESLASNGVVFAGKPGVGGSWVVTERGDRGSTRAQVGAHGGRRRNQGLASWGREGGFNPVERWWDSPQGKR